MQMFKLWKPYRRKFNEKLKERFSKTCKFSNHDNKFILLLPEGVCLSLPIYGW